MLRWERLWVWWKLQYLHSTDCWHGTFYKMFKGKGQNYGLLGGNFLCSYFFPSNFLQIPADPLIYFTKTHINHTRAQFMTQFYSNKRSDRTFITFQFLPAPANTTLQWKTVILPTDPQNLVKGDFIFLFLRQVISTWFHFLLSSVLNLAISENIMTWWWISK